MNCRAERARMCRWPTPKKTESAFACRAAWSDSNDPAGAIISVMMGSYTKVNPGRWF